MKRNRIFLSLGMVLLISVFILFYKYWEKQGILLCRRDFRIFKEKDAVVLMR